MVGFLFKYTIRRYSAKRLSLSAQNLIFARMYYKNILETIGHTPLVRLNRITKDVKATVLAKVETTNPGNSIKDRMV